MNMTPCATTQSLPIVTSSQMKEWDWTRQPRSDRDPLLDLDERDR